MTDSLLLKQFIKKCESDFMCFCGIDTFPPYNVVSKEMTLDKSKKEGFDSVASAFYDVSTGAHRLEMLSKLYLPQMNAEYLVFHELTHILDAETYSQKDKCKNVANKGYTEYLMAMYASNAGKSGGEFFTPTEVSELLTRLGTVGKKELNKVYDMITPNLIQLNYSL